MRAHAIAALRAEWAVRSRGPQAADVLTRLAAREPDLAAVAARSLPELFAVLERPSCLETPRWQVTGALIRQFHLDELVALGLVASLTPALLAVARRLDWGQGGPWPEAEAFAADLVTETWLVLHQMGGTSWPYPERAVADRLRRRLAHRRSSFKAASAREAPTEHAALEGSLPPCTAAAAAPERATTLDALAVALATVDDRVVRRDDVRLVFQNRVLGYSIAELAAGGGGCRRTLEHRRGRAEAALCA